MAETGDDLEQLPLSVAGDAGESEDLAAGHVERDVPDGALTEIVERADVLHAQPWRAVWCAGRALAPGELDVPAHHQCSQLAR